MLGREHTEADHESILLSVVDFWLSTIDHPVPLSILHLPGFYTHHCRLGPWSRLYTTKQTIPTSVQNKPFLAIKIAAFAVAGFGTPFAIAAWHL
jgi:hypothetical protein